MKDIFSLRKRRAERSRPEAPAKIEAPAYRESEEAFEYSGPRRGQAVDDALQAEDRNVLLKANLKPLPRCPECATAVGDGQRECHHCGRGLRKMP
ncbi:MAG TPA: hypothetical protein VMW71_04810 [Thermoplasmata archaeon]|nr:hypothetical protein [Thermoplasmata archaeon]